ncbi:mitochondrial cytochrome oxidase assembly factor [Histoplasma capsulatum var. duboisii H88]|uniref:Mitochondrial cytochrome oxidase assembly factor n=1 Tax=Ajellomyces capsulatus (strain H88) TaxID=544711 RepID=F0UIT2_AJEC8|nr:mitochondrial cytochrome oxidase assembly factor [Histoplasma capsulatum var. duboisii H88]
MSANKVSEESLSSWDKAKPAFTQTLRIEASNACGAMGTIRRCAVIISSEQDSPMNLVIIYYAPKKLLWAYRDCKKEWVGDWQLSQSLAVACRHIGNSGIVSGRSCGSSVTVQTFRSNDPAEKEHLEPLHIPTTCAPI